MAGSPIHSTCEHVSSQPTNPKLTALADTSQMHGITHSSPITHQSHTAAHKSQLCLVPMGPASVI